MGERVRLIGLMLMRLNACATTPYSEATWEHLHVLAQYIITVVIEHFSQGNIPPEWFGAAQTAMDLSFDLQGSTTAKNNSFLRCPDKVWEQILDRMLRNILGNDASTSAGLAHDADGAIVPVAKSEEDGLIECDNEGTDNTEDGSGRSMASITAPQLGGIIF